MAKERSLRLINTNSSFFENFTNRLKTMLIPTKVSFNYFLVSIKRHQFVKSVIVLNKLRERNSRHRVLDQENLSLKLYEEYLLYIEKYVLDSMYKKIELNQASELEKDAISESYRLGLLKNTNYSEYIFKKQIFLLELDYNLQVKANKKLDKNYKEIYAAKQTDNYRELFKNFSTQLSKAELLCTFLDVFKSLERYTLNVIPISIELGKLTQYDGIEKDYDEFLSYRIGKLDEQDFMEKNLILISIGRKIFTHSIPHPIVSKCYLKLLADTRILLVKSPKKEKREKVFEMIKNLVVDYSKKVLLSKIYWEDEKEKQTFLDFWNKYIKAENSREKEILILKKEIVDSKKMTKYKEEILKIYLEKLKSLGIKPIFGYVNMGKKRYFIIKNDKKGKIENMNIV